MNRDLSRDAAAPSVDTGSLDTHSTPATSQREATDAPNQPQLDSQSTEPASPRTSDRARRLRDETEHLHADPLFGVVDDDDMSAQPSLFELGDIIHPPTTTAAPASHAEGAATADQHLQSTLGPARASRRDETQETQLPSTSLGPARTTRRDDTRGDQQPSTTLGPARYFSARRDDQGDRRFFSDVRPKTKLRPKPDVSVIFRHLGMTPSGEDSGPQGPHRLGGV